MRSLVCALAGAIVGISAFHATASQGSGTRYTEGNYQIHSGGGQERIEVIGIDAAGNETGRMTGLVTRRETPEFTAAFGDNCVLKFTPVKNAFGALMVQDTQAGFSSCDVMPIPSTLGPKGPN